MKQLRDKGNNVELQALVENIGEKSPADHPYRGYTIVNTTGDPLITVQEASSGQRPVWYVFSGMGSQWNGMGKYLMTLEVFQKSILKMEHALQPYGASIYSMLMESNSSTFDNPQNAFMGINAVQVLLKYSRYLSLEFT